MQARLFDIDTALITPRTVVRRFRENEGSALYQMAQKNHSRLHDHFPRTLQAVSDKEKAEYFVRQKFASWLLQQEYCFGIWEKKKVALIGLIQLFDIDWHTPSAEISFFIDKKFEGKGIMTEVLQYLLRFAFEQLKIEKLKVRTAMDNYAAQRLVRKCSFRREGDLRSEFKKGSGDLIDVMLFGATRGEYNKV